MWGGGDLTTGPFNSHCNVLCLQQGEGVHTHTQTHTDDQSKWPANNIQLQSTARGSSRCERQKFMLARTLQLLIVELLFLTGGEVQRVEITHLQIWILTHLTELPLGVRCCAYATAQPLKSKYRVLHPSPVEQ